jgi:hypothetical protein
MVCTECDQVRRRKARHWGGAATIRVSKKVIFYFWRKTKFCPNFVEISMFRFRFRFRLFTFIELDIPTKFHTDFVEISMSKSEFRFRFRCRNRNFDFGFDFDIGIPILISISEFRFWHRNFSFGTRFQYTCRNGKAFFTEISQKFYFDYFSEFWFRPSKSKSKFRLLSIISIINFFESRI